MLKFKKTGFPAATLLAAGAAVGFVVACATFSSDRAADAASSPGSTSMPVTAVAATALGKVSPVKARGDRGVYYPNTEDLARDEMRIIALGTGMPNQRPSQKAACFLVELGNGDKFLFDLGTGSADNLAALQIPYDYLDKVFLSHLHTDHFGDFGAVFVGGLINGRTVPLRVWGPSGPKTEWGTKYALERWREALSWDVDGRAGRLPASGQGLEIHEFDYRGENEVVYQDNGVTIRSWPAIHVLDGPVSYSLEWKGLKFVFGGDTYPNTWFPKYAGDADVVIHECFITVPDLVDKMNFPVARALNVGTQIHTPPPAFGKVMSMCEPRMAIAYHFFNDFDTAPKILEGVRQTYSGPLTLADDMMVWNVTKDRITVRDVVFDENVWSPPLVRKVPVDRSIMLTESDWTRQRALDMGDIILKIYDRANKLYGTNEKPDM
ncbi:MAG: guanitoxin biosynthesis MBL fold metallo-hydrolase GntH [Planctomycetota bacterium]|jgi:ribonuclease Z